jgi:hypothetical protein
MVYLFRVPYNGVDAVYPRPRRESGLFVLICSRSSTGQDGRMTDGARRSWFPGLLAVIGGGAIIAGCLLTWLEVGGGVSVGSTSVTATPKGTELLLGQVAFGAGVAVLILGLLLLMIRRARRLLGFLVIVGGLVAIAAGAFVASSPQDRYIDFAVEKGAPAGQSDEVRASLANLFEVSGQEADLGMGMFIAIGGGALALIAGLTAVFGRRKPKPVEETVEEAKEPSEPEPEALPEEWLAARAMEAEARSAAVQEPPPQVLVTEPAPPPLPDPPPEPEEAAPWRSPLPEAPESPAEEEPVARAEEIEAPSDAPEEPAAAPEPVMQTVTTPEPSAEPAKPDDGAGWSKPLPDDWTAKPAKRRRRRS